MWSAAVPCFDGTDVQQESRVQERNEAMEGRQWK